MNPQNTPLESGEDINGKNQKPNDALRLLKKVLDQNVDVTDPQVFNEYEKDVDVFVSRLRRIMREENDLGIPQQDIDKLTNHDIAKLIATRARKLVSERSRLNHLIKTTYPAVRDTDDWESRISKQTNTLTLTELNFYIKNIKRKKSIASFLESAGFNPEDAIPEMQVPLKLREIFYDSDTLGLSATQKKFLTKIVEQFERTKTVPDIRDIKDLLQLYKHTSKERKKELLVALNAHIPLGFAAEYGLLSEEKLSDIFEKTFGKIYSGLTEEQQKEFQESFLLGKAKDDIIIPFENIDATKIDVLYEDRTRLDSVADSIVERLNQEEKIIDRHEANILAHATQKFPDEDDHQVAFRKYVAQMLSSGKTGTKIEGIEKLAEGSIIEFEVEVGKKQYFRLHKTHDENDFPVDVNGGLSVGVIIEELPVNEGYLRRGNQEEVTYDAFYGFFEKHRSTVRVLDETQFQELITHDPREVDGSGKIYDARDIDTENLNLGNIVAKVDTVDSAGRKYGFEKGTYFSVKDEAGTMHTWKVLALSAGGVKILSPGGSMEDELSYEFLGRLLDAQKVTRVSKIQSDDDFIRELQGHAGLLQGAYISDRELFQKNRDKDGKEKTESIRVFAAEKGGQIRIDGITDGVVAFSEYEELTDAEARELAQAKNLKSSPKGRYKMKTLSYGAFIEYLKENKLQASTKKPIDAKDAHSTHDYDDHDHSHLHGSFLSRLGKMQTLGSMWKGLEMVWHSIEHTLEKGTKLDAARFAMRMSKFIPSDAVEAQIYADIVDSSKEIVEKYKNKINNLPGPKQRHKCIHIVHNKDSRPEEVMAAIQFMVSGYGHLYAEDIREFQSVVTPENLEKKEPGYFAFLDAFILTSGLPGGLVYWRKKAYDKAKPDIGDEGEPPEEMLLHALFKSIDGNYADYPYAASVVKAIGGPGGFERDWKMEGTKNAIQKGRDQTTGVNSQGRLNRAVGYLATHEFYKGIGAMEQVAGKVKVPEFQAFPFIWAVGGYAKYASGSALQEIKGYAEKGYSFHAYSFMRKRSESDVYRGTVQIALQDLIKSGKLPTEALADFNTICHRIDHGPEADKITKGRYGGINPPAAMMEFWQKYASKGLHDMLQGHDGWLMKQSKENSTVRTYMNILSGVHDNILSGETIPGTDIGKDWYDEHGLGMNLIFHTTDDGLQSLAHTLKKIKFTTPNRGGKPMNADHKVRMWDYLVKTVIQNKDTMRWYGDTDLQRKQYFFWRQEIITYFAQQLSASSIVDKAEIKRNLAAFEYFRDFEDMGIDPMAVFDPSLRVEGQEADYQAWINGGRTQNSTVRITDIVRGESANVVAGTRAFRREGSWNDSDVGGLGFSHGRDVASEDSD